MYRRLFTILSILVIFTLLTSTPVFARPEPPEEPTPVTYQRQAPANFLNSVLPRTHAPSVTAEADDAISAQAIAVGSPVAFGYDKTYGQTGVAYFDDAEHINGAIGITVDNSGNVYMVEEGGARLLKFASDKTLVWKVGIAGLHDWGVTGFNTPREVVIGPDGMLWVGDNDIVSRFDPDDGSFVSRFPEEPWNADENERFQNLTGIAFDSAGRVYLADRNRQRVQVFNVVGDEFFYQATIGTTDQWGSSDNNFDSPGQIVIDSDDNLYVADFFNHRIQKCVPDAGFISWGCERYVGTGSQGGDDEQLSLPYALGITADDTIFLTDNANGRVKSCVQDAFGDADCDIIISGLNWPSEVAPDPLSGNIYVFVYGDTSVQKYQPSGTLVDGDFAGTPGVPYLSDSTHFDLPRAVEVDAKGNLYILEEGGARLIKFSAAGVPLWTIGEAGIHNSEDPTLLANPSALAIDPAGKKLVVANSGRQVRFYNALTGAYLGDLHKDQDNYRFDNVQGIAIDKSGNIYVSDRNSHTVKIYNKLGVYIRQIGNAYESGPDNAHLNNPTGLAVDASGNLYIADQQNCRVQKFDKTGKFLMTFGTTMCGWSYDRMGGPMDVAVDSKKNVYVAEEWNSRVSVYNASGAYLGYIGGSWSDNNGSLKNPSSVAVDNKGGAYVVDKINSRVQKFTLGVPYAAKISQDNFGGRDYLGVWALGMFKGQLYAGTTRVMNGLQIWRQTKTGWEAVITDGFEDGGNNAIDSLYEYKGYLYASTYHCTNEECSTSNGGQLWRSPDGATWQPVIWDGFENPDNAEIFKLAKLGTQLCATTWGISHGAEMWCSASGDPGTWVSQIAPGFGDDQNIGIQSLQEYNGMFFAGTLNTDTGAQLYRKVGSGAWTQINFPSVPVMGITDLVVYKTYLYAMAFTAPDNTARVYRCKLCDGTDWTQVDQGFGGDPMNRRGPALEATKSALYAVIGNMDAGISVWKSTDGLKWAQVSSYGLGNANNVTGYWGNGVTTNGTYLYIGTVPNSPGGAVWKICAAKSCK